MTQVGTTSFYYYNFSGITYGTTYVYQIVISTLLNPPEAYRYGASTLESEFNFDACYGPKCSQDEVFEDTKMLI